MSSGTAYLKQLMTSNDIIALSEHCLYNCQLWKLEQVNEHFRSQAKSCRVMSDSDCNVKVGHSGVALLWRDTLDQYVKPIKDIASDRMCAIELCIPPSQRIMIVSVYLPHRASTVANYAEQLTELENMVNQATLVGSIVILGDINAHFGNESGPRCWGKTSHNGHEFSRFVQRNQLNIIDISEMAHGPVYTFHSHTRHEGESYIDHCIVSQDVAEYVTKCCVYEDQVVNTSDHLPVGLWLQININANTVCDNNVYVSLPAWGNVTDGDKERLYTLPLDLKVVELLRKYGLQIAECDVINDGNTLDKFVQDIINVMNCTANQNIPKKKRRFHLKPYWTNQLTVISKKQKECWRLWVDCGRPRHPDSQEWVLYKDAKREFRRSHRETQRQFYIKQVEDACRLAEMDQKGFWFMVNKIRKGKTVKTKPIKGTDGRMLTDPNEIAEDWRLFYQNLFKRAEEGRGYDDEFYRTVMNSIPDMVNDSFARENNVTRCRITESETKDIFKKLKSKKSPGLDGITNEHLKYSGPNTIFACTVIFNSIIQTEHVPQQFKKGLIVPIPKGGKKDETQKDNNRPITLLPVIYKAFEKALLHRLDKWLLENDVISDLQGAAQAGCSSSDTVLTLQESIAYHNELGSSVYVVTLDAAKAFDSVWIEGLFYKLFNLGIEGRLWRILRECYDGFTCQVVVNGVKSGELNVERGVHQGAPLSMRLYQLFNNDMLQTLSQKGFALRILDLKTGCPAFADDIALLALFKLVMNILLRYAYGHSLLWRYDYNAKKSGGMCFGKDLAPDQKLMLGDEEILLTDGGTHMGVPLCTTREALKEVVVTRAETIQNEMNVVMSLGSRNAPLPPMVANKIYRSICIPKLTYGLDSCVLNDECLEELEKAHRYCSKKVQGLPPQTPIVATLATLGLYTIESMMYYQLMLMLYRWLSLPYDSLYKKIVLARITYHMYGNGSHKGPIYEAFKACQTYGLLEYISDVLETGTTMKLLEWKKIAWKAVKEVEVSRWRASSILYSKLSLFRECVCDIKVSIWWQVSHLHPKLTMATRVIMRLLSGEHCLMSNVGRYSNMNSRLCPLCEEFECENVPHMLFVCSKLNEGRVKASKLLEDRMLPAMYECFCRMGNQDKTAFLLSGMRSPFIIEWMDVYDAIATYVYCMYQERHIFID